MSKIYDLDGKCKVVFYNKINYFFLNLVLFTWSKELKILLKINSSDRISLYCTYGIFYGVKTFFNNEFTGSMHCDKV